MLQDIAPHIYHNPMSFVPPAPGDLALAYAGGQVLARLEEGLLQLPRVEQCTGASGWIYGFSIDETHYYLPQGPALQRPAAQTEGGGGHMSLMDDLNRAGIASYLPYAQVSSSDGVYGNGLWSASPLDDPSDDDVDSSASFMPGGTVSFNGGATQVRFVSVHTTSPTNDYWQQWKRSLDELAKLRFDTSRRYVFMGDFNATYDHTPFRNILGNRFSDASRQAGEGLKFSWPANVDYVPSFAGIDHIVLDSGMQAGQVRTVKVDGSDHKALLAIVRVG